MVGTGRWRPFEGDGATAAVYEWNVRTSRAWMNRLARLARPLFAATTTRSCAKGGLGLAARLGAPLLVQD